MRVVRLSGRVLLGKQAFDHRQAECGGLAGAGLGKADQVAAFEKQRDRLRLDGRRRFEAERGQRVDDLLGQTKRS